MGTFLVNVHVQTDDRAAVERELRRLSLDRCWLTPPSGGWTSVYEEQASTQNDEWIRELTIQLSARVHAPAIAFLVHDSDLVCYWLFDRGRLLDEFNSCPDYFDAGEDGASGTAVAARLRGQPDVLVRYCRQHVHASDIENVLASEPTFAEEQLAALAELLGIDVKRVMTDYRDLAEPADDVGATFVGTSPPSPSPASSPFPRPEADEAGELTESEELDDVDVAADASGARAMRAPRGAFGWKIAKLLGLDAVAERPHPLVAELVAAAASGDLQQIDRLLDAGADIEGQALLARQSSTGSLVTRMLSGGAMSIPVTPLMAAVAYNQHAAMRRLLDAGANVNAIHAMFGTPIHAAACAGDPAGLQILIAAGGKTNQLNAQGQTPWAALAALRMMSGQLQQLRSLGAAVPAALQVELERLIPKEGWDECERILRGHGGV